MSISSTPSRSSTANFKWRLIIRSFLPSAIGGFFLARFLYELDPIGLSFLGDWPGSIGFTALIVLAAFILHAVTRRLGFSHSRLSSTPLYLLFIYIIWPQVDLHFALILLLGSIFLVVQDVVLCSDRFSTFTVGALVFLIYFLTLGDHVGRADTFEFQVVGPQLGIAHPTGYPLYILIGKLFSFLPINSMAWRINLTSAVCATIALVLIYRLIVSLLKLSQHPERSSELAEFDAQSMPGGPPTLQRRVGYGQDADVATRLSAAIASIALASSSVFWSQAIIAEVYALNALFVAGIISVLVWLIQNKSTAVGGQRSAVYLLALTFGLALSHHLTIVILIPFIVLTLILVWPKLKLQHWLMAVGCLLIGLTPWLYVLQRWPALHNGTPMALTEWTGWIFGQRFGGALSLSQWSDPTRWGIVSRIVLDQFGPLGLIGALIGLIVLFKRSWRVALITFGIFAGYIFYGLVYNVPDVDVFIIPAFIIMSIWIGIALYVLSFLTTRYLSRTPALQHAQRGASVTHYGSLITNHSIFLILFSLLPITLIATNYPLVNQYGADADREAWGRYVLSLPTPLRAALLVDSEKIAPLYYLQVTEHIRPDLDILVLGDESLYREELDKRIAAGQPVYLARFLPNLPYHLRSLGPLVEVSTQPGTVAPNFQMNLHFGDAIDLTSISIDDNNPIRVTFSWQAVTDARPNYHLRLQLIDDSGRVWWEDTGARPVNGYYPTGAWTKGETVTDYHEIKLDPFVPPGRYTLRVGFYVPFRAEGLLTDDGTPWQVVTSVQVKSIDSPESLAHEIRSTYGAMLELTAVDVLGIIPPLSHVVFRLNSIGADSVSNARLSMVNSSGLNISTAQQVINVGQSRLEFNAPEMNGVYTLRLDLQQPARCHWLAPITADCEIGSFEVSGEAIEHAINFENQVLLTEAKIDRATAKPGEAIHIDLTWRGLKTWSYDYTAFVHLIGPDGKVHGQIDQWPVQGTLPTSNWVAGQTVNDPYVVTVTPDAPSGKYQVEAGWYLLATLRRLSVLDSSGRPSDDHVIIGEFNVP